MPVLSRSNMGFRKTSTLDVHCYSYVVMFSAEIGVQMSELQTSGA